MAKLYFNYGTMNSSKTANALMTHFNYQEVGQRALLCKSETDTRDGERIIQSRIGLRQECILLCELMDMPEDEIKMYHCIIVDEVIISKKRYVIPIEKPQFQKNFVPAPCLNMPVRLFCRGSAQDFLAVF